MRSPSLDPISPVPLLLSRFTHNHHNSAGSSTTTTHNNRNTQTIIIRPYQTHNPKARNDSKDLRLPKVKVTAELRSYNSITKIWDLWESDSRWTLRIICPLGRQYGMLGLVLIVLLILLCIALNFQIPRPSFPSLSVYQVPKSTKASTLNTPICNFLSRLSPPLQPN